MPCVLQAMVTVQTEKYGVFDCKPLQFIWSKFEEYNEDNTVMLDDLRYGNIETSYFGMLCSGATGLQQI